MKVTSRKMAKDYKGFISKYKRKWHTDVRIWLVPEDVTDDNVEDILTFMIDTGYTFLTSYYMLKYGNNRTDIEVKKVEDLVIPSFMSKPKEKKVEYKRFLAKSGVIHPVTIDSNNKLLDGYATFTMMRAYGDAFVPCMVDDNYEVDTTNKQTKLRKALYTFEGGKCYICGRQVVMDKKYEGTDLFATVDHMTPVSKGGSSNLDNCRLCCGFCNSIKADREYSDELKQEILQRISKGGHIGKSNTRKKKKVYYRGGHRYIKKKHSIAEVVQ